MPGERADLGGAMRLSRVMGQASLPSPVCWYSAIAKLLRDLWLLAYSTGPTVTDPFVHVSSWGPGAPGKQPAKGKPCVLCCMLSLVSATKCYKIRLHLLNHLRLKLRRGWERWLALNPVWNHRDEHSHTFQNFAVHIFIFSLSYIVPH